MKDSNNISQELLETIEHYYNGAMAEKERLDFELKLEKDPEFKTQVEDIKTLILGIENQSLKEQLDVFHESISKHDSETSTTTSFFSFRKLAAAIVILLAISGFWWFNTPQHEKLYGEFFTPDPGLPTVMSSNTNFEFYDAMVNYKQGDYNTAIEKWESISGNNDTITYFLGVAHLANGNEKKAVRYLTEVTQNSEFALANEAHFYLGLAHLKKGNVDDAKNSLKHSNTDNSKTLLSKLND